MIITGKPIRLVDDLRVEIDDRIREQPEHLRAVTEAMASLGRYVGRVPLPTSIMWRFLPLDPNSVELLMSDTSDFSDIVARHVFPLTQLSDPYTREVGTLRTFGELLRHRSDRRVARIDELIRRIDFNVIEQALQQRDEIPEPTVANTLQEAN